MPPRKKAAVKTRPTPDDIMNAVNAAVGRVVLKKASDPSFITSYIPTGLLPIDELLQGGIPRGRHTMIVGDYSTLKSYVGLATIKECQDEGGIAGLIDTERSFDPQWAEEIGVNVDDLVIYPPRDSDPGEFFPGELAIDAAEAMVRNGIDLIVFDSIAATLPQDEQNKRLYDENQQPARLAALMSKATRKLTSANNRTAFLWINQFRMQVGMTFGDPNIITGGRAMPYYSSYIIVIKRVGALRRERKQFDGHVYKTVKQTYGQQFQATLIKSKLSKPFGDVYFDWSLIEGGIDMASFLMARGIDFGLIKQRGKTWHIGTKKAASKEKCRALIASSPAIQKRIETKVRSEAGMPAITPITTAPTGSRGRIKKRRMVRR